MNGLGNRFFPFLGFAPGGFCAGFAGVPLCGAPQTCGVRKREINQCRDGFIGHLLPPVPAALSMLLQP